MARPFLGFDMADILKTDYIMGVREALLYDTAEDMVHVSRTQDCSDVVERMRIENIETGGNKIDGIGRKIVEMPLVVLQNYCEWRGIPWEKFAYTNEYDAEFRALARANPKLSPMGAAGF